MTEDTELVSVPGGAMALPADLVGDLEDLALTGEELGSSMLDMLAIYSNDKGRWKCGETKKDAVVGIYLHGFNTVRSYWPPDAPMGESPPLCWSPDSDVPHEDSGEPQHKSCEGCPWDQFKTAKQGTGKGCKTKRADFIIEVDPDKLTVDEHGVQQLSADAVIGLALIRGSSTAKGTRKSVGQWAKEIQANVRGIPQLALTRWELGDEPGPAGDYSAPRLHYVGAYSAEREALEEVIDTAKSLRDGEAIAMLATLAGKTVTEEE
jgi:hypothetical protein